MTSQGSSTWPLPAHGRCASGESYATPAGVIPSNGAAEAGERVRIPPPEIQLRVDRDTAAVRRDARKAAGVPHASPPETVVESRASPARQAQPAEIPPPSGQAAEGVFRRRRRHAPCRAGQGAATGRGLSRPIDCRAVSLPLNHATEADAPRMMTSIPLSSALTSRAGVLAGWLGLIALLAVAIPSRLLNLELFAGKFDEGIRGTQLMLMAAGYRPFREIFASQGPLSLDVFYPSYALFGQTLGAARLAPALFSIVGIVVAAWTARHAGGLVAGAVTGLLLTLSPIDRKSVV